MENSHQHDPLKRLRYFTGRILSARDFEVEQAYFREKLKRHNRYLHGSGVVTGLQVSIEDNRVVVSPGMALDCTGEEIAVPETARVDPPDDNHIAFLMIGYAEEETDLAPAPGEGEGDPAQALYTRESFKLSYEYVDPFLGHGEDPLVWVPCGKSHPIPLAKLFLRRDAWEVDPWFQPPSIG